VIKQADLVLAMHWRGDAFTPAEKVRNFGYYEARTVRDSSLSSCTQAVMAAETGHLELAHDYLGEAALTDLHDSHSNTSDGVHLASLAGAWQGLVAGFGGMRDHGGVPSFDPRLPVSWPLLRFRFCWQGSRVRVDLVQDRITFTVIRAGKAEVPICVRGRAYTLTADAPLVVGLDGQGDRIDGLLGDHPVTGGTRADGSRITAGVPEPVTPPHETDSFGEVPSYVGGPPELAQHLPE
jgi:alpha,alpha-trehalose phosphorylase